MLHNAPIYVSQVLKKYHPRTGGAGLQEMAINQPVGGLVGVLGGRVPETVGGAGASFTE